MEYTKILSKKTREEYVYVTPGNRLTEDSCRQLILEINEECLEHGYERIMVNLSKKADTFTINDIFKDHITQDTNKLLPARIAWVNDDPTWEKNCKPFNLAAKNESLPWRSFSQPSSGETWLLRPREEALLSEC